MWVDYENSDWVWLSRLHRVFDHLLGNLPLDWRRRMTLSEKAGRKKTKADCKVTNCLRYRPSRRANVLEERTSTHPYPLTSLIHLKHRIKPRDVSSSSSRVSDILGVNNVATSPGLSDHQPWRNSIIYRGELRTPLRVFLLSDSLANVWSDVYVQQETSIGCIDSTTEDRCSNERSSRSFRRFVTFPRIVSIRCRRRRFPPIRQTGFLKGTSSISATFHRLDSHLKLAQTIVPFSFLLSKISCIDRDGSFSLEI